MVEVSSEPHFIVVKLHGVFGSLQLSCGDCPPQDGTVVGDDDDADFPLREGSSPSGIAPPVGKSAPAQVPPRDGGA